MNRAFILFILVISFSGRCFAQKLVFVQSYQSAKDIDNNDWTQSTRFAKGDTVLFVALSSRNPDYYQIRSKEGISFVYSGVVIEVDRFFETERQKMDNLHQIVLSKNTPPLKKGDTVKVIAARYGEMGAKVVTVERKGLEAELKLEGFSIRPKIVELVDTLLNRKYLADKAKDERLLKERNARLKAKYGSAVFNKMLKGIPWLGMSSAVFVEMFGEPEKVNRTVTSSGVREQWVYSSNKYYYFENDVLKAWQD